MKLQIVEKKFKRGKAKGSSYYSISAATSLAALTQEFGQAFVTRELIVALDKLLYKCNTEESASAKLQSLKEGKRKDYSTATLRKALDAAIRRGDKKEAKRLFAELL